MSKAIDFLNANTATKNFCELCGAECIAIVPAEGFERTEGWNWKCPNAKGKKAWEHTNWLGSKYSHAVPRRLVLEIIKIAEEAGQKAEKEKTKKEIDAIINLMPMLGNYKNTICSGVQSSDCIRRNCGICALKELLKRLETKK